MTVASPSTPPSISHRPRHPSTSPFHPSTIAMPLSTCPRPSTRRRGPSPEASTRRGPIPPPRRPALRAPTTLGSRSPIHGTPVLPGTPRLRTRLRTPTRWIDGISGWPSARTEPSTWCTTTPATIRRGHLLRLRRRVLYHPRASGDSQTARQRAPARRRLPQEGA